MLMVDELGLPMSERLPLKNLREADNWSYIWEPYVRTEIELRIAKNMAKILDAKNLTPAQLSKTTRLNKRIIEWSLNPTMWEHGRCGTVWSVQRIADALGVDVAELVKP